MPRLELRKLGKNRGLVGRVHLGEAGKLETLCNEHNARPFHLHKSRELARRVMCPSCFGIEPAGQWKIADEIGFKII